MILSFLKNSLATGLLLVLFGATAAAQQTYQYSVDLTKLADDKLEVELITPVVTQKEIHFYLPKIVPGTYMNSNYGKYVQNLRAFNKAGKALPVDKFGDNGWTIKNAAQTYRISYTVEDTWDATIDNKVYSMCGTSFEAGKNFILNTPGIFGYFEGMKQLGFNLSFIKPAGFYAATGLMPASTNSTTDVFKCANADHLYDSPIMYSLPDTATIKVGKTTVLIAVYSPHKMATAKFIADHLQTLLLGAKDYLGGKLPVEKYAFIFYFNGEQPKSYATGAWEHSYSSFYSLDEAPEKQAVGGWVSVAAHEFFHIVTPLTICSKEVRQFNFNETVLSKHLWLYEGSTEYFSQNMQAWSGIITPEKFLENMSQKIAYSKQAMNDSLSFTELSKASAGKHADQYGNVYMKGALINNCIDLYLLQLSNAQYGLRQLKHDLGVLYGKDKYFEDDSLFNVIEKLTYPEIGTFFKNHVEGGTPIPYATYFAMAGVDYIPVETYRDFTLGGLALNSTRDGMITIGVKDLNEVGRKMGYKEGDILISLNDSMVNERNMEMRISGLFENAKEGDVMKVKVKRLNDKGEPEEKLLQGTISKVEKQRKYVLHFMNNPTSEQLRIRNVWLNGHTAAVNTKPER
jgi:predicted metalloprotease with PDZ domain